nr:histidine phosphatase family protein [uncultured Solibaculum sp.]
MKSYTIHLIRHGLTDGNAKGQYIGSTDLPLAPEGLAQLLDLKERFVYPKADAYFTSPLLRCRQTLKALYPDSKPLVIPGLSECNFGRWEGKTANDLQSDPEFVQWIEAGGKDAPPGGESSAQFQARCCEAFSKVVEGLMKTGTTSAVIVTHGGVIMTLLATFGLPRANFYDWLVDSGCGYSVRITPNLWMRGQVVEVYDLLPSGIHQPGSDNQAIVLDIAREAANRAWGDEENYPEE